MVTKPSCQPGLKSNIRSSLPIPKNGVCLVIRYRTPSLNDLFQIGPWGRYQSRRKVYNAFMSELQRIVLDSSTPTTCAPKDSSTSYVDPGLSRMMIQRLSLWKLANEESVRARKKRPKLK